MLIHICCSVDSHYFLSQISKDFPNTKLIGYFYNPNIHPFSEYELRLLDVRRSCNMLDIELIEGEYNIDGWLNATKGYEDEPEKGKRCSVCFEYRFVNSAKKAQELGESRFTSTLLTSPKKSLQQLTISAEIEGAKYGVEFVSVDYRKGGGTQKQMKLARKDKLYHQNYCGCLYALDKQREQQSINSKDNKHSHELYSPISNTTLPNSIEEKIDIYEKRVELEKKGIGYKIIREKFYNYRIQLAKLSIDKIATPCYTLYYSTTKRENTRTKIDYFYKDIAYLVKDEIRVISLDFYNNTTGSNYIDIIDLIYHQDIQKDMKIRENILFTPYSLSTIIVVDEIVEGRYDLELRSKRFEDVKEILSIAQL